MEANANTTLSIYDLNKQLFSQLPPLNNIADSEKVFEQFINETNNQYYMLYGKEISYFTLFVKSIQGETLFFEAIECLKTLGIIKSIEPVEGAIEFWITNEDNESTCLYLFPYDAGVVPFGG